MKIRFKAMFDFNRDNKSLARKANLVGIIDGNSRPPPSSKILFRSFSLSYIRELQLKIYSSKWGKKDSGVSNG